MEDKERQRILEKVKKLLKLKEGAEKIGSEGEAYAAAEGIHRLLTQYNISMDEIPGGEEKSGPNIGESEEISYSSRYGNWKRSLLNILCTYNYCQSLVVTYRKKMLIVGQEDNVVVVRQLYEYLVEAFNRLCDDRWEEFVKEYVKETAQPYSIAEYYLSNNEKKRFFKSYFLGATSGLHRNFENRQPTSDETPLMVVHQKAIDDYLSKDESFSGKTVHFREVRQNLNEWAASCGYEDGKEISLDRQIGEERHYQLQEGNMT